MFENFGIGWQLGKQVRKLVFGDKKLLVYPLLSALAVLVEALVIFGLLFVGGALAALSAGWAAAEVVLLVVGIAIFYIGTIFISTYFLVAMLLAFRAYTAKKPIGFGQAMGQASQYTKLILEWAIFYGIILMIIRAIESRFRGLGGLILNLAINVGLAVAIAFVIPVIIDDKVGPISALKTSAGFFVKNFGKTVGGIIYADLYNLMFILAGVGLLLLGIFAGAYAGSLVLGGVVAVIGLALMVFGVLMNFITVNAYKLILYDYLNGGKLPAGIDKSLVDRSVAARRNRGRGLSATGNI